MLRCALGGSAGGDKGGFFGWRPDVRILIPWEFDDRNERVVDHRRLLLFLCDIWKGIQCEKKGARRRARNEPKFRLLEQFFPHSISDTKMSISRSSPKRFNPVQKNNSPAPLALSFEMTKQKERPTDHFANLTTALPSPSLRAKTEYPVLCQSMMILLPINTRAN